MSEHERVAAEDVRRVAELANLELTTEEEVRMQRDLNAILDYVAQLNELDTPRLRRWRRYLTYCERARGCDDRAARGPPCALP